MKKILKSKLGKYFLYTLLCVCNFAFLNAFIGWLTYKPDWILQDIRLAIFGFVILNIFVDVILIICIRYKIDTW